jgi:hypothetical protein
MVLDVVDELVVDEADEDVDFFMALVCRSAFASFIEDMSIEL